MAFPISLPTSRSEQRGAVLRLGLPAVGEQLLNLMVGLVDTYVVGHLALGVAAQLGYGREVALAAVGAGGHITWMLTTMFMALALGCTVVLARFVGAKEGEHANRTLAQSMVVALLVGLASMGAGYLFAPQLMAILNLAPEVRQHAVGFLRISMLSMPLSALLFVGNAALRGAGDTRTPLVTMLVVNGVNAGLSLLLVNGLLAAPALGIAGAAWASTAGRAIGGLIVVGVLIRGRSGLVLRRIPRPDWGLIWRILRQGLPFAAEQFIFQGALLIFVRLITQIGTVAYAAHSTIITVESISFLPGMGFATAATTLVGQELGAGRPDRAAESGYEAFRLGVWLMGVMGLAFVLVPELFLRFFVADERVVAAAVTPLRMVGLAQPALAAQFIFSGGLRGGGDAKWPLYSKMFSVWLVRLPLAWLLVEVAGWGLNGIWLAMSVDFVVQGLLAWRRFARGQWRAMKV